MKIKEQLKTQIVYFSDFNWLWQHNPVINTLLRDGVLWSEQHIHYPALFHRGSLREEEVDYTGLHGLCRVWIFAHFRKDPDAQRSIVLHFPVHSAYTGQC